MSEGVIRSAELTTKPERPAGAKDLFEILRSLHSLRNTWLTMVARTLKMQVSIISANELSLTSVRSRRRDVLAMNQKLTRSAVTEVQAICGPQLQHAVQDRI